VKADPKEQGKKYSGNHDPVEDQQRPVAAVFYLIRKCNFVDICVIISNIVM
jgi:hypothetical protein